MERKQKSVNGTVNASGKSYELERIANVNAIAFKFLRERMGAELSKTLFRAAVKEMAEAQIRTSRGGSSKRGSVDVEIRRGELSFVDISTVVFLTTQ